MIERIIIDGVKTYHLKDDDIYLDMLESNNWYESELLNYLNDKNLLKNKNIIDVGANVGIFSLYCAAHGADRILAIEPQLIIRDILRLAVINNDFEDIIQISTNVIGDIESNYKIKFFDSENSGRTQFTSDPNGYFTGSSLDNLVPLDFKVDLIKIDVEGSELSVLKSATKLIEKYSPTLVLECWDDTHLHNVNKFLNAYNYKLSYKYKDNYVFVPYGL